jgi:predicted ATPase
MKPRINLYGGPGVGKSTLAAKFFTFLKQTGINAELVQEFVKQYVYSGRHIKPWEYVHTFARQFEIERLFLQNGVHTIVTDSPLLLQCIYARHHGCPVHADLRRISDCFDRDFPSVNIFVRRHAGYCHDGRWENEDEAIAMDRVIEETLQHLAIPYTSIRRGTCLDYHRLLEMA